MTEPEHAPFDVDRFWEQVDQTDSGCWEWTGARTQKGYGRMSVDDADRYAHRLSHLLHHGDPDESFVLHHCDNPPCVNPDHLYAGNRGDNQRDAEERGQWNERGENNSQSKLSRDEAMDIRRRANGDETNASLASEYEVSKSLVSRIKTGKRW